MDKKNTPPLRLKVITLAQLRWWMSPVKIIESDKTTMKHLWIAALLLPSVTIPSFAHSGGLNAQGCHNNRKTGDYHCHRSASPPVNNYAPVRDAPQNNKSAEGATVKMSRSGICHTPGSSYYAQTMNFTPYLSLDACLSAGGRLPKR